MGFLVVALAVLALIHYYLWRRLVRATTTTRTSRLAGTLLLCLAALVLLLALVGTRVAPHDVIRVLAWPGYLWLAVAFYLVLGLLVLEVPTVLVSRVLAGRGRRQRVFARREPAMTAAEVPGNPGEAPGNPGEPEEPGEPDASVSRRLFLARTVAAAVGVASVAVVGSGIGTALGPPLVKRVRIPLARLPRSADGLRIALVSDIHLGPLAGLSHTRRIVDLVNEMEADVVAIVGDTVDGSVAELGSAAAPLRELRSTYGAYVVTGNHEYYSGHDEWLDEFARLGVRPLRNERVELPRGVDIAGVNDVAGGDFGEPPDFDRALAGRDPSRTVIMLAHQPVLAAESAKRGVDLQLSGHTHGGQIVPFNLVVRLSGQPVVSGLGMVDGMPVYVTNGAGFWGPPVRVGAPPDITLVELQAP